MGPQDAPESAPRTALAPRVVQAESPCTDPLFVDLGKRALENLTPQEFEYLMVHKRACYDYSLAQELAGESRGLTVALVTATQKGADAQKSIATYHWTTFVLAVAAGFVVGVTATK